MGADETITFDKAGLAADVDVGGEAVWGEPAAEAMMAMLTRRADRGRPLTWISIGSVAGPAAPVPSVALRSAQLRIVGSGIGSVSARDILAELPAPAVAVNDGTIGVRARPVPLAEVSRAWAAGSDDRVVFVP